MLFKGGGFKAIKNRFDPYFLLTGNDFFRGPGKGLPGGGPELVIDSIPTSPWPKG